MRKLHLVGAVKAFVLAALERAGYVVCKRDMHRTARQHLVALEAAAATMRERVEALEAALAAEHRRAARFEAARAEAFNARLAAAHLERQLEQARAELWAVRQSTRRMSGGAGIEAEPAAERDRDTPSTQRPHRLG